MDSLILYLRESEFDVHTCMRGDQALAAFREVQPDAVILDINLP